MHACRHCGKPLKKEDMSPSAWRKYDYQCRPCANEYLRKSGRRARRAYRRMNDPAQRAKRLVNAAKRRAKSKGLECTLDWRDVLRVIEEGYCEVTGLPFDLSQIDDVACHPRAPSIDRIDLSKGYIPSNVKVVIWQHNMAKAYWSEELLAEYCAAYLERN